ncbi:hypothetical protein KIN20_013027 [Parelaphostrongylus tenuis]|uniref:Uncharacterized protein n=1 Tax=Parelaphostrongylus tenuis TaxID=148309 RepID=A0AAD5QKP9_PARTN|nr:hypothetical protein KIN20_013027 [Parelaphostrongylus tenuis]
MLKVTSKLVDVALRTLIAFVIWHLELDGRRDDLVEGAIDMILFPCTDIPDIHFPTCFSDLSGLVVLACASDAFNLVFQVRIEALAFVCVQRQCRLVLQHFSRGVVLLVPDKLDVHLLVVLLGEALLQVEKFIWKLNRNKTREERMSEAVDDGSGS